MLYTKIHELITEVAGSGRTEAEWTAELRRVVDTFQEEVQKLEPAAGRHARDELCAQIEHEALVATNPKQRTILLTALKGLEAIEWPGRP